MIVPVDGAELHYTTRGHGPACLVLSAIGTKPYERLMPAVLSDRLTLVFVDLRGGGRSSGRAEDLTFDLVAEDLDAIRADLGVDRAAVLGHSILGVLAIEYARRRPTAVSHLVVGGTPPRGDMAWLASRAASFFENDASPERKQLLRDNMAALPPNAPPARAFAAQTPMRFFDGRLDAASLFAEAEVKPALLGHILGPLTREWDVTVEVESLRVPMLLAHGRYDYTVPYVLWDGIAARLPDATVRLFERSGHHPFFEEPELFADVLTTWMDGRRPRGLPRAL